MRKLLAIVAFMMVPTLIALADTSTTIPIKDGNLVNHPMNVIIDGSNNITNVQGARNLPSINDSAQIAAGGTLQQILPAVSDGSRQALEIQNNQGAGTDLCYLVYGSNIVGQITSGVTRLTDNITVNGNMIQVAGVAKIINPGQAFTRYYPYVPNDLFFATCSTTGDFIHVMVQ